jgi:hypothetical protein
MVSRQGPPLAVGDVNGDGLDDVFIGGGAGLPGRLLVQRDDGSFAEPSGARPWAADTAHQDWGALLFDADGDGRKDLYVASGGYHLAPGSALLHDRLYINRGAAGFARAPDALPAMPTSTAAVRAADFDGDGRLDLFVGGRLTTRAYPLPARSYILRNEPAPDGAGGPRFTDVTMQVAPELARPGGMVTDAVWVDFDGDGRLDLVTAGEWMPIEFYRNEGGRLRNVTSATGLPPMRGWWFSLEAGDFDGDGRPDLVAGNLGLNLALTASGEGALGVYAGDLAGNGATSIVLTREIEGTEYPAAGLAYLGRELYPLGLRFPTHGSFAPEQLARAIHYRADTFASVLLRNEGNGAFTAVALPNLAQIAPVRGIVPHDVDGDGNLDLVVAGNLYDVEPNTPRADAGNGLWLRGDGRGHFAPVPPGESGLLAPRNVAGLALLDTPGGKVLLVANTGDSLQAFAVRRR